MPRPLFYTSKTIKNNQDEFKINPFKSVITIDFLTSSFLLNIGFSSVHSGETGTDRCAACVLRVCCVCGSRSRSRKHSLHRPFVLFYFHRWRNKSLINCSINKYTADSGVDVWKTSGGHFLWLKAFGNVCKRGHSKSSTMTNPCLWPISKCKTQTGNIQQMHYSGVY